jgi:hypothetical protein
MGIDIKIVRVLLPRFPLHQLAKAYRRWCKK